MEKRKNFVAIVTGSATGVGAECVKMLAAQGTRVVVNYTRSTQEAEETAAACCKLGVDVALIQADISDDAACRDMVKQVIDRWGQLDILINNAACTVSSDPFDLETLSGDDFQKIFSVNVVGTYQMCRAAIPHLRSASNGGSIVNVSSHVAFTGGGTSLAYTASKGAINALTLALARTCGPSIRVNAVCPGVIDTRWMQNAMGVEAYNTFAEEVARRTPLGRVASAKDVAEAAVWLATGAAFITGELLSVDGGVRLMGARRPQSSDGDRQ